MPYFDLLKHPWKGHLASLICEASQELLLVSPYVSHRGSEFVKSNLPQHMRESGRLSILTDLSPMPICQGATDPFAVRSLAELVPSVTLFHLPKLHAKVYIADSHHAIVTSANLTAGGLDINYEFGVDIADPTTVAHLRDDLLDYSRLGAMLGLSQLESYCLIAERLRNAFRNQLSNIDKAIRRDFDRSYRDVEDRLIQLRLAGGAVHTVFAKTIDYLLRRDGPLTTPQLHALVQAIHPDLCDDTIDRVIDGHRFGKKWKHAVRTAQQMLKKQGKIALQGDVWAVIPGASE